MKFSTIALVLIATIFQIGCSWQTAKPGSVEVKTQWDKFVRIIRPEDGGVYDTTEFGIEYYTVSLLSQTTDTVVQASSKDNAALNLHVAITYHLKGTEQAIQAHLDKFGYVEKTRNEQFQKVLIGQLSTEARNAINEYEAYGVLANQEAIQKQIDTQIRPILDNQLGLELETVQILGRPDFVDDRIEQAASQVVANQKLKEAAQAGLEADKVEAERQQVRAKTYENPALLAIRKLELQVEIAREWRQHSGTLVFGTSQMVTPTEK